ncbi:MAG: thiamine-phosphate kinase, partial [Candidatus Dormibacteraceae bacterium]
EVGWRALAFALGDLAAKGAEPTYGMVSISIPPGWKEAIVEGIYSGMAGLAVEIGLRLIGGDTTSAPTHGSLWLALWGRTSLRPIPRSEAQAGWVIGVSGPLGGAGLNVGKPRPRLKLGATLTRAGVCCGDISDGLLRELDKFAAAAPGVGARLKLSAVPTVESATLIQAISSGEEVELIGVAPGSLPEELIRVGELTDDGVVRVVDDAGEEIEVRERGYDHFG